MEGRYLELYNHINMIEKLDGNIYSELLSIYGEGLVNKVIEQLISEEACNLDKFEYYLYRISSYDNMISKNVYNSYIDDISLFPTFSKDENIRLTEEIFSIICQIKGMFNFSCVEDEVNFDESWISDNVKKFMEQCDDTDKLEEMKKLFSQFLSKRNKLIEGNLRLVILLAKQFKVNDTIFVEAIQMGNMGLMRAIEKFSPEYKVTFATYAYYWIKQFIIRNIYNVLYPYSIPANKVGSYYTLRRVQKELYDQCGREATNKEIAEVMGVSVKKVELLKSTFTDPLSLYETYGTEEEKDTMLIDFIEDENFSISRDLNYLELVLTIERCMDLFLNEQEKTVIKGRFGFNDGDIQTLDSIAKKMGRTKERVRQIETKALRKLNVRCSDLKDCM